MQKQRIAYLDMVRGLGIFLVVLGHISDISEPVRGVVTAFHMPLFFVVSGILFFESKEEDDDFRTIIRKKGYRLMLPYLVFSLLYLLIEAARLMTKHSDSREILIRQIYQSASLYGVSTLWFLSTLFLSTLVFWGIRKYTSHAGTIASVAVLIIVSYYGNLAEQSFFLPLTEAWRFELMRDFLSVILRSMFCVCYLCGGYYFAYVLRMCKRNKKREAISAAVLFLLLLLLCNRSGVIDIRTMVLGNLFVCLGGNFSGSFAVILFWRAMEGMALTPIGKLLSYFGRNSLIIMLTHIDFRILNYSTQLATLINRVFQNHFLYCILILIFVFIAETVVIWVINRFFPFLVGRRKRDHFSYVSE